MREFENEVNENAVNERILKIRPDTSWFRTTVVVVYTPVDAAADEEKDEFYMEISERFCAQSLIMIC